jgi:hypothetical protein
MVSVRGSLRRLARPPIVFFGFLVAQLRKIPGAGFLERHVGLVLVLLLLGAVGALSVWMAQRTPQRVSLPQLAAGELAPMQTWIIVTGDLRAESATNDLFRYAMTDPATPDTTLFVTSEHELAVGRATVSGTLIGGDSRAPAGFPWIGQLRADPVLARESDPPWIAIGLAAVAVFLAAASRSSYPTFFGEAARSIQPAGAALHVGVRRHWPPTDEPATPATLAVAPGGLVALQSAGVTEPLQIHSANSSYDVGSLFWLGEQSLCWHCTPRRGTWS